VPNFWVKMAAVVSQGETMPSCRSAQLKKWLDELDVDQVESAKPAEAVWIVERVRRRQ
jgi:hypothetical protein